jgi:hypothetical protein
LAAVIGTVDSYGARCSGYLDVHTISSAYGFMHLDGLWGLVSRADIASVGKQMAIKSALGPLAQFWRRRWRFRFAQEPGAVIEMLCSRKATGNAVDFGG